MFERPRGGNYNYGIGEYVRGEAHTNTVEGEDEAVSDEALKRIVAEKPKQKPEPERNK